MVRGVDRVKWSSQSVTEKSNDLCYERAIHPTVQDRSLTRFVFVRVHRRLFGRTVSSLHRVVLPFDRERFDLTVMDRSRIGVEPDRADRRGPVEPIDRLT